jgi:hypothetical protein
VKCGPIGGGTLTCRSGSLVVDTPHAEDGSMLSARLATISPAF